MSLISIGDCDLNKMFIVSFDICLNNIANKVITAFVDGSRMELVNLSGTIPVRYRGSVYNIPICIWLIDTHPKNAPIYYSKPTPDMSVKVLMFVDNNGKYSHI